MMTILSQESTLVDGITWERRIGKSNFWVQITREELGPPPSWRLGILLKPSRPSKSRPPMLLAQFSPQKPLLTFELDGQRYPLKIDRITSSRGGKIVIGGGRNVGASLSNPLTWVADLTTSEVHGTAYLKIDARFRCAGVGKKSPSVLVQIPLVVYEPVVINSPLPDAAHITAAVVWADRAGASIGLFLPNPSPTGVTFENSALTTEVLAVDTRSREALKLLVALRTSHSESESLQLIRGEVADAAPPRLPTVTDQQIPLLHAAHEGIRQMLDSKSCTTIGKERWYFRASGDYEYGPGYPFYTAEASPSLFRWSRIYTSEAAERTANLTARGVAADFAVIVGESGLEGNKGAFWDCASGTPNSLTFSSFDGKKKYGVLSNARITTALFQMYSVSRDPLFRQAALNACHWLLLKQNEEGYFSGAYVSASSGKFLDPAINLDGVSTIQAFVAAFRATGNEVFIKAAWKVAAYLKDTLLPYGEAPCLYDGQWSKNCPVALSSVIMSLLDLDAEAPNDELRSMIAVLSDWLAVCRFDDESHFCLNYDGAFSGALECGLAALRLFAFTGKQRWFHVGQTLIEQVANVSTPNWRLADAAVQLMLCLAGFAPGASMDLKAWTVTLAWGKYAPDQAAVTYYDVRDSDQNEIDFLPLVNKDTHQTLLILLARTSSTGIHLIKRNQTSSNRIPIIDQITGEQCGLDLPIHILPSGLGQFAVLRIDP